MVTEDDWISVIEHRFFPPENQIKVYHGKFLIGKIGANRGDTFWCACVRAQEQFGYPAKDFEIQHNSYVYPISDYTFDDLPISRYNLILQS